VCVCVMCEVFARKVWGGLTHSIQYTCVCVVVCVCVCRMTPAECFRLINSRTWWWIGCKLRTPGNLMYVYDCFVCVCVCVHIYVCMCTHMCV